MASSGSRQTTKVPKNDWLIVVGHHPADEMDVEDFVAPMNFKCKKSKVLGSSDALTHSSCAKALAHSTVTVGTVWELR